jgi:antitoxin (DNA-binding transcriptional repressor) of toxin-antitoxin stability system
MENRITATDLARKLGDVLGRIRYRRESFIVERNGEPVARIAPVPTSTAASLAEGLKAWRGAGSPDPGFADDLDRVNKADSPPRNPRVS